MIKIYKNNSILIPYISQLLLLCRFYFDISKLKWTVSVTEVKELHFCNIKEILCKNYVQ